MRWFKHYSNANTNPMIQEIIASKGLDFAMRYWLLLEYLCEEFKEDSTEFNISTSVFSSRIHIKHIKKLESFAQVLTEISAKFDGNSIEIQKISNNFWKIKTDILLKLMSRDYKKARTNRAPTAPKKENKKKNKKENKNIVQLSDKSDELDFDFEYIYNAYPKKQGKKKGFEIMRREIKTPEDRDNLILAIDNYSLEVKQKDPEFIKMFSTFMGSWTDWIDYEKPMTAQDKAWQYIKEIQDSIVEPENVVEHVRKRHLEVFGGAN